MTQPVLLSTSLRGESTPVIEVAAGLVFRAGQLLITQRRPADHLGGLWEFPGGKREEGEDFEACLRREMKEELGLEVEPGELLDCITHAYPEKTVHLRFYRCTCEEGEPQLLGCNALAWIKAEQLDRYAFPAADAKLIELLQRRRDLWDATPHSDDQPCSNQDGA